MIRAVPAQRSVVPRRAHQLIAEALADTRVVAINGARQSGKSTLALLAAAEQGPARVHRLDDPSTLRAALEDPTGFLDRDELQVVDEVQLAPELFRVIKVLVDTDPRPGRFLLTGSAQILALRDLPDALPGRMEIVELWPFSQGEIHSSSDHFIDAAFASGADLERQSPLRRLDYLELAVRGGFPEAVKRTARRRGAFFDSYVATLIERDVRELATIERQADLRRLLSLLAGRAGGLLVTRAIATTTGLPAATVSRYLELLSAVFLIKRLPAWSGGQTQRAIGTPKLIFVDTGIACHLMGQDAGRLAEPDGAAGPMLENLAITELAKQLTWSEQRGRLYHYRTRDDIEVDAVIETPDGRVVAFEVKAAATIRTEDLRGLRHLAARLGPRFVAGFVLYTGQQTHSYGDRIKAIPLDALWTLSL